MDRERGSRRPRIPPIFVGLDPDATAPQAHDGRRRRDPPWGAPPGHAAGIAARIGESRSLWRSATAIGPPLAKGMTRGAVKG